MAQHGYLREYDRGWDGDYGRERDLRGEDRERGWHGNRDDRSQGDFMFGERDRSWNREIGDRASEGYFGAEGDHFRSWFRGDERQGIQRGDWDRLPRHFSSSQDDHYRSWRDRQMSALDRDYEDYCREREQQFHNDFDSWRRNRKSRDTAGEQQGMGSSEDVMELTNPTGQSVEPHSGPSATADATLGTNNSENSGVGRGGRKSY